MTVRYRTGLAHVRRGDPIPPALADVLYSLLSDADAGSRTFNEFCDDYGYDADSRRALDTYLECQQAHTDLVRVLGRALMTRLAGLEH